MAGRPKLRAMVAELCRRARASGLDEAEEEIEALDEHGLALAYCLAWIRGGNPANTSPTVLALARDLGVSRPLLYEWLTGTDDRKAALALAREDSGSALAEEALHILDTSNPLDYQHANARANFRKWLASVMNRRDYGQQVAPTVAISVGALHLAAHEAIKALTPSQPMVLLPQAKTEDEQMAEVLGFE
jgi:hypothetical protein